MILALLFYVTFVFLFIILMSILLLLWNSLNIFIAVNCFHMNALYRIFIIRGQLLCFLIYFSMNLPIQSVIAIINSISIIFVNLQSSYSISQHLLISYVLIDSFSNFVVPIKIFYLLILPNFSYSIQYIF